MRLLHIISSLLITAAFSSVAWAASLGDAEIKLSGESCGHAKAGRVAELRNKLTSKSIKVTVETRMDSAGSPGYPKTSQRVVSLPAGGSKILGCS